MAVYKVRVTEEVDYIVPVEFDPENWDEEDIEAAAIERLQNTPDRAKWLDGSGVLTGEYLGMEEA